MYYASVSLLAILILFISNRDIIFNKNEKDKNQINAYRNFLLGVLAYYIIDVLWGVFDFFSLTNILYVDTVTYFIAMGIAVLLWSKYVVTYLEKKTFYSRALVFSVQLLLLGEVILIIVNFFTPILFYYNDEGEYLAGFARYVLLILHAVTFLLTSVYTLLMMRKQNEAMKVRYHAIGIFGIIMLVLITSQIFNSSLPFYAVGFLLGSCLLHSFVIEGEKEEYRQELEKALEREKKQKQELDTSRRLAYTDPLTGIRNKMAYLEVIEGIDNRIKNGEVLEFAIAVFDINRLKIVNDTLGHENGDQYIINGCRIICSDFKHSPVFRIGGDEFVAILQHQDYENKDEIEASFKKQMVSNVKNNQVVISLGIACYIPDNDHNVQSVFERADKEMYKNKQQLKGIMTE